MAGIATASAGQDATDSPNRPHPRAHELRELAAKVFPPPVRKPPREDVTALRQALESLEAALVAAESDPSSARVWVVRERFTAAQDAFAALRGRLAAAGSQELATDLDGKFQILWHDLDQAIAASQGRRESLATARAQLRRATSRPTDPRGSGVTVVPILPQE